MRTPLILAAIPLILAGLPAWSGASEEGRAHLLEVFQTYLGTTEGVVAVDLAGDAYQVTLDVAPLTGQAASGDGHASLSPQVLTLTDQGDGTWGVSQDQSVTLSISVPGQSDMTQNIASQRCEGVFDEALMTFSAYSCDMTGITSVQTVTDPAAGAMTSQTAIEKMTLTMTGKAGSAGGVDATFAASAMGYTGTMAMPGGMEGVPSMPMTFSAESMAQNGAVRGLRPEGFYKTVAWFVAHPSLEAMTVEKARLKPVLQSAMPFFDLVSGEMTVNHLAFSTPMGEASIAELSVTAEASGAVREGKLREAITLSGLTLPAGVLPDWAVPILPQKIRFDAEMRDFDMAAGLSALLDLLDLPPGAEPDDAFDDKVKTAFLPDKTVTIALNPGLVSGEGYELTFAGDMSVSTEMDMPVGKALISLSGIENLQAAIATAPPEEQAQAMMMIGMAQGMAKPGANGELVWEIDASTPGSLSVNGMPMMGGQ